MGKKSGILKASRLLFFGFMVPIWSWAQDFEGSIQYKLEYTSKKPSYPVEVLEQELGTTTQAFFKACFSKEISNSRYMAFQLYRPDEKTLYFKHQLADDTLRMDNYENIVNEKFEFQRFEGTDTILGIPCNTMLLRNDRSTIKYYFAPGYPLTVDMCEFPNTKYAQVRRLMSAVVLGYDIEYQNFKVVAKATSITRQKLEDADFALPDFMVLKKE
jgi:hypothetical protein